MITKIYAQCLKNYTEKDFNLYFNSIKYFREILCTQNTKFDKTKEINPKYKSKISFSISFKTITSRNESWKY